MTEFGYKKGIRELLEIISDPVKRGNIGAVEIMCGWFDDLYLPADDPNHYNPGVYEKGVKDFESCFSQKELIALQSFHEYFSSVVEDLNTNDPSNNIQEDPVWINIGLEALKTLGEFD